MAQGQTVRAIGKGDPKYAFDTDFWGRPVSRKQAPDLGAFAFDPFLTTEAARDNWEWGGPTWCTVEPPDFCACPARHGSCERLRILLLKGDFP